MRYQITSEGILTAEVNLGQLQVSPATMGKILTNASMLRRLFLKWEEVTSGKDAVAVLDILSGVPGLVNVIKADLETKKYPGQQLITLDEGLFLAFCLEVERYTSSRDAGAANATQGHCLRFFNRLAAILADTNDPELLIEPLTA